MLEFPYLWLINMASWNVGDMQKSANPRAWDTYKDSEMLNTSNYTLH